MNYVIAHEWNPGDYSRLGIYSFFGEFQKGTVEDAQEMLDYVKRTSPDKHWSIYQVAFTKLDM